MFIMPGPSYTIKLCFRCRECKLVGKIDSPAQSDQARNLSPPILSSDPETDLVPLGKSPDLYEEKRFEDKKKE